MKLISLFITSTIALAVHLISSNESVEREVLTSQRLVVTKTAPLNNKSNKTDRAFEAELRDVFTVICYEGDSNYVELDWTVCPGGNCPEMGQFKQGTPGYEKIGELINKIHRKTSKPR